MASKSVVTEILLSSGALLNESFGKRISCLAATINDQKTQIEEKLSTRYQDFLPVCIRSSELSYKIKVYSEDVATLTSLISSELKPTLNESSQELEEIRCQLATAKSALQVVNELLTIHDALETSQIGVANGQFAKAFDQLDIIARSISDLQSTWDGQIQVLISIQIECAIRHEKLRYELDEAWKSSVVWTDGEVDAKDGKGRSQLQVHKSSSQRSKFNLVEVVQAMEKLQDLGRKLTMFSTRLQKSVVEPIVTKSVCVDYSSDDGTVMMTVTVEGDQRPSPTEAFDRLSLVVDFLHAAFGDISITNANDSPSIVPLLGGILRQDLYETVIRECLGPAVPSQRKELDTYGDVVDKVTKFQKRLCDTGLATSDDNSDIVRYALDVDTNFANKMCQELLTKARKLMLGDLHHSVVAPDSESPAAVAALQDDEKSVCPNILKFPACHISKSACDLVHLLYKIMEEATVSSPMCASRLFCTVRNIVVLYCNIVPDYHRDSLETLPQPAALLHNNCMYISHHLKTLGHQFQSKMPGSQSSAKLLTFLDLIPRLNTIATETFLSQMRYQKKQLLVALNEVGTFQNILNDKQFASKIERALKQCLLHLQHLSKVWPDVLPSNVYNRAVGTLLNTLLDEVIQRVVVLEDLPAQSTSSLVTAFGIVEDQSPKLFQVSDGSERSADVEIHRYVPKWNKFRELLLMLSATLTAIVDRWSDGKGPLALEFTVDEVKRMIRALFQNTDRRAAALCKIK